MYANCLNRCAPRQEKTHIRCPETLVSAEVRDSLTRSCCDVRGVSGDPQLGSHDAESCLLFFQSGPMCKQKMMPTA